MPEMEHELQTSPSLTSSDIRKKATFLTSLNVFTIGSSVDTGCDVFSIRSSSYEPTHLHLHTSYIQPITEAKCIQGRGVYCFPLICRTKIQSSYYSSR